MSLYNLVAGYNPDANIYLSLLDKTAGDFGRFRDVYVEDGCIVVHTRCGGGNREDYEHVFAEMEDHPWYLRDEDNDFDCTYADIIFKMPDNVAKIVEGLYQGKKPADVWQEVFEQLQAVK